MKYVAVVHAYNEEESITRVVNALCELIPNPMCIVLVDDGSTDGTHYRLLRMVKKWKGLVSLYRITSPKLTHAYLCRSRAFRLAVEKATAIVPDWEYLLKVDGDAIVPSDYIAKLRYKMRLNPKLGIASGVWQGGKLWVGRASNGAVLYRRSCWDDIEPPSPVPAWDTLLMLTAYRKGWWSTGFPSILYTELRPSDKHTFIEYYHTGIARYLSGFTLYHTFSVGVILWRRIKYYLRGSLRRLPDTIKFYLIGGVIMTISYLLCYVRDLPKPLDEDHYEYMKAHSMWETVMRYKLMERAALRKGGFISASSAQSVEELLPILPPRFGI